MSNDVSAQRLAYLHIRDAIVAGYFPIGSKLRPEAIASGLRTSRLPVRDALYQLYAEGFVLLVPNRGAFVRAYSGDDIIDLSDMRAVLEALAGRRALERLKDEHILELEYLLERSRRCGSDYREFLARHDEFHLHLYEFSGRASLVADIKRLRLIHRPYLLAYCLARNEQEMLGFEHDLILDELKRRDAEALEQAIRAHVMRNAENIAQFIATGAIVPRRREPRRRSAARDAVSAPPPQIATLEP